MGNSAWEITQQRDNRLLLAIIVPNDPAVSLDFTQAMRSLQLPLGSDFIKVVGLPYGPARNSAAKKALELGYNLAFLDSDVRVQPDAYLKLMDTKLDLVSGLYYQRFWPFLPVAFNEGRDDKGASIKIPVQFRPGDIFPCDFIPGGLVIYRRRMLEALFARYPTPFCWGLDTAPVPDIGGGQVPPYSEDFTASWRCKQISFQGYVHSVASYEPVVIKRGKTLGRDGIIDILPLEDLYQSISQQEIWVENMETKAATEELYIWGRAKSNAGYVANWIPVKRVMRHEYSGELVRVNTGSGIVDVSPNHVLIPHSGYGLINASDVKIGDKLAMPLLNYKRNFRGKKSKQIYFWVGTEDLAWLYGLFAAEGSASRGGHSISISNKNQERLVKCKAILESHFHHPSLIITDKKTGVGNAISQSPYVHSYFRSRFYTSRSDKRVPTEILNAPDNIKRAFLQGYWEGDGTLIHGRKASFASASRTLAMGILWIKLQVEPSHWIVFKQKAKAVSLYFTYPKPPDEVAEGLCACGCGQPIVLGTSPASISRARHGYRPEFIAEHGRRGLRLKNPRSVKKISKFSYHGYLYDIETSEGNFSTGVGLIKVHNTGVVGLHETRCVVGPRWMLPMPSPDPSHGTIAVI